MQKKTKCIKTSLSRSILQDSLVGPRHHRKEYGMIMKNEDYEGNSEQQRSLSTAEVGQRWLVGLMIRQATAVDAAHTMPTPEAAKAKHEQDVACR